MTIYYLLPVLYTQSLYSLVQARRAARWRAFSNGTFVSWRHPKPIRWSEHCTVRLLNVRLAPSFNWMVIWANIWLGWLRTICLSYLSPLTFKANCPLQFARSLVFFPSSMYSWYTLDCVDLENPSFLRISEIEWPMRRAPTICPRKKAP